MIRTRHRGRRSFTPVDAVFGVLGFIAGLGAAICSYTLLSSLALAIFAFAVVSYLVGRALPDVISEDRKVQRAAYFALLPTVGTVALYTSYLLWEGMWLAVILGFVAGGIAQALLGRALFLQVRMEEVAEERDRAGSGPRSGQSQALTTSSTGGMVGNLAPMTWVTDGTGGGGIATMPEIPGTGVRGRAAKG